MEVSPPTPPPEPHRPRSGLPNNWWLWLIGVVLGLLALGTAYWTLREQPPVSEPVSVVRESDTGTSESSGLNADPAATTGTEALDTEGGHSALLELDIPTGFPPPQLQSLSFAAAFGEAAAYRGWHCQQTEVVLFSDARQALPAVQEQLLALGYQVTPTEAALGEDEGWIARHATRPDLFGSFSSGEEGRGNVSLCSLPN